MNVKEAKEELNEYKFAQKWVDWTLEEYERYKIRAEKVTSIITGMPHSSGGSDKVADNAIMMAELSKKYVERWKNAERIKLETEKHIDELGEPYRSILMLKYIRDMRFEDIADSIGYSYGATTHMHGDALEKYAKKRGD